MKVQLQLDQQFIEAPISKVDSRVTNNQFTIEVALPSSVAEQKGSTSKVRRGQSVDANIVLGAAKANATLLARGAFFTSSGGNWVYVLSADGQQAERRAIRLGKRNQQFFEVLDGLVPGERVITSSYSSFDKATVLTIQ